MKIPAFQFYPGDWLSDPALRSVSVSARGLWIDMLCLMFNGERRGYLQVNGKAPSIEQIARMCNATIEEVRQGLSELADASVFSESADHVIFSRRMLRDDKIRQIRKKCGSMGGNPEFIKGQTPPYFCGKGKEAKEAKKNLAENQKEKIPEKVERTPSSSSSSSRESNDSLYNPPPPLEGGESSPDEGEKTSKRKKGKIFRSTIPGWLSSIDGFEKAWRKWEGVREVKRCAFQGQEDADYQLEKLKRLSGGKGATALEIVSESAYNHWQGLFEPKERPANGKRFDPKDEGTWGKEA